MLLLAASVSAKHTADGANSILTNVVDIATIDAKRAVAQTMHDRRVLLFNQAKAATEARDIALGHHATQSQNTVGTVLFEVKSALRTLQAVHTDTPNAWTAWGFEVVTSSHSVWKDATGKKVPKGTAGAVEHHTKPAPRVHIPEDALALIALAKSIVAKHIADGALSPLTNFVDTATLQAKAATAETEHALSVQLHRDSETARENRDIALWGDALHKRTTVVGSVAHELSRVEKLLVAAFPTNLHRLGDWGFTVNAPTTPATPATPPAPTPTPPNNNPNNPN